MSTPTLPQPTTADRHARAAVAALFLTNGALFANILPRFPEVKQALGMSNSLYGIAVAAYPTGAIAAGLASGALIRRFGSARVAVMGTILTSLGVLAAGTSPSVALFMFFLFLGGGADAITDVGQNAHALRVQRNYGRSIINSFHAVWSVGMVLGGLMAAGAIAVGLPLGIHLVLSALVFGAVALTALRFSLPGRDEPDDQAAAEAGDVGEAVRRARGRTYLVLAALVLIATAGAVVEDAGMSWATLYLKDALGAPAVVATSGFITLVGAQFVGRLTGDRLVDRFGQRAVARVGGLLALLGMGLALAFPTVATSLLGFAAAGFGVATLVPSAMHQADELPGLRHGAGLTIVSWLMRIGFLASPPLVGWVADQYGLRFGLLSIPLAGLVVLLGAGALAPRERR